MKIYGLRVTDLRNEAHVKFNIDMQNLVAEDNEVKVYVYDLFSTYVSANEREDYAFNKITKSEITEKIVAANKTRRTIYRTLKSMVKSLQKHYNQDVREAAVRVKIVFDKFGKDITNRSYDEQTAGIAGILQEIKANHAADAKLIGITEVMNELELANAALDALMKARLNETSKKNADRMQNARAETDAAYIALKRRVNALVEVEGAERYAAFITKANLLVDRYKLLLSRSKGKRKRAAVKTEGGGEETGAAAPAQTKATSDQ